MYDEFLRKSGKTELLSFFRGYEVAMKGKKKFISPEDYYNENYGEKIKKVAEIAQKTGAKIGESTKGVSM